MADDYNKYVEQRLNLWRAYRPGLYGDDITRPSPTLDLPSTNILGMRSIYIDSIAGGVAVFGQYLDLLAGIKRDAEQIARSSEVNFLVEQIASQLSVGQSAVLIATNWDDHFGYKSLELKAPDNTSAELLNPDSAVVRITGPVPDMCFSSRLPQAESVVIERPTGIERLPIHGAEVDLADTAHPNDVSMPSSLERPVVAISHDPNMNAAKAEAEKREAEKKERERQEQQEQDRAGE